MCVIFVAEKSRIKQEEIKEAWVCNSDGAGVAYRAGGMVHWNKGLNLEQSLRLAATLPLPYMLHLRYATVGGKDPRLCHPFPIDQNASTKLRGASQQGVLTHNGHWSQYEAFLKHVNTSGPWSDSRVAAWVAGRLKVAEMLDFLRTSTWGKYAVLTPKRLHIVGEFVPLGNGTFASNQNYQYYSHKAWSVRAAEYRAPTFEPYVNVEGVVKSRNDWLWDDVDVYNYAMM